MPGNFHISTHAFNDIAMTLEMKGYFLDFTHKIHSVSFGDQEDLKVIKREFPKMGVLNPLDGRKQKAAYDDEELNEDEERNKN